MGELELEGSGAEEARTAAQVREDVLENSPPHRWGSTAALEAAQEGEGRRRLACPPEATGVGTGVWVLCRKEEEQVRAAVPQAPAPGQEPAKDSKGPCLLPHRSVPAGQVGGRPRGEAMLRLGG